MLAGKLRRRFKRMSARWAEPENKCMCEGPRWPYRRLIGSLLVVVPEEKLAKWLWYWKYFLTDPWRKLGRKMMEDSEEDTSFARSSAKHELLVPHSVSRWPRTWSARSTCSTHSSLFKGKSMKTRCVWKPRELDADAPRRGAYWLRWRNTCGEQLWRQVGWQEPCVVKGRTVWARTSEFEFLK